jgi:ParB family chromosome partitioning protein
VPLGKTLDNILDDYFGQNQVSLKPNSNFGTSDNQPQLGSSTRQQIPVQNLSSQSHGKPSASEQERQVEDDFNQQPQFQSQNNLNPEVREILIAAIELSPFQTRTVFEPEKITSLAKDIQDQGLIQPIVVLQKKVTSSTQPEYVLLAGERRLRAVKTLGVNTILAVVKPEDGLTEKQQAMLSAMENLQREDLSPVELGQTFRMLMLTQQLDEDGLAGLLGTSSQYVKNYLRLLTLTKEVKQALLEKAIGEGQARYLVPLSPQEQVEILEVILAKDLTVKEIKTLIDSRKFEKQTPQPVSKHHNLPPEIIHRADRFASQFPNAKLKCSGSQDKGKIVISWDNTKENN